MQVNGRDELVDLQWKFGGKYCSGLGHLNLFTWSEDPLRNSYDSHIRFILTIVVIH